MKTILHLSILIFLFGILTGCDRHETPEKNKPKTYAVQPENVHKTLYFTGTVQPLSESTITNPMEAVIASMHYHFGQAVKKGDVVFTLSSSELEKQYNATLTDYLKAKDSYNIARAKFVGIEDLRREGLVSKNNYLSERSNLNTARINLIQATRKLTELLAKMGDSSNQTLSGLSFAEFDKVRLALSRKHNRLYVKAPAAGILLYPPKNDSTSKSVTVGSKVKSGEVLALIGDLTGIRVEIDVPEVDVDKIKPGLPAIIRTTTYPNEGLKGELVAINAQASTNNGGALPSFTAIVEVKHLSEQQQNWIKVGMSAAIEISVDKSDKLLVPISAVKEKNGERFVCVREANGGLKETFITTGAATADKVTVESGLRVGDKVVYG